MSSQTFQWFLGAYSGSACFLEGESTIFTTFQNIQLKKTNFEVVKVKKPEKKLNSEPKKYFVFKKEEKERKRRILPTIS